MTAEPVSTDAVEWRWAGHHLWLGRVQDSDVGILENDGRYAAIDGRGRVRGVYPTLLEAQLELEALAS